MPVTDTQYHCRLYTVVVVAKPLSPITTHRVRSVLGFIRLFAPRVWNHEGASACPGFPVPHLLPDTAGRLTGTSFRTSRRACGLSCHHHRGQALQLRQEARLFFEPT